MVTNMRVMFQGASAFNQAVESWNTIKVTGMGNMFYYASAFNQAMKSWNTPRFKTWVACSPMRQRSTKPWEVGI